MTIADFFSNANEILIHVLKVVPVIECKEPLIFASAEVFKVFNCNLLFIELLRTS